MQRNGIRERLKHVALAAALVSTLAMTGCALPGSDQSLVRVTSRYNPAKAGHLTRSGIKALHHGAIDLAAKKFREAIAADASYGPAHNNLGLMHFEQGNLYQAVMAFEQARELMPSDPTVVYNLALTLESAGRVEEALDLYYTANAMDGTNPHFLGNLVRLRVRLGEHDAVLHEQLRDLVLIETRPDWRRWADEQLGLTTNIALDRGPSTPDLESTANEARSTRKRSPEEIREKIIDLTPVETASLEEEVPTPLPPPPPPSEDDDVMLDAPMNAPEQVSVDPLSEDAYYGS